MSEIKLLSRPIEFRAWISFTNKMYYDVWVNDLDEVEWFDPESEEVVIIGELKGVEGHNDLLLINEALVMQYIGLRDKNKKKIFDGDVIKRCTSRGNTEFGYVTWEDVGFGIKRVSTTEENNQFEWISWPSEYFDNCEVIGNIFEHPNLLKGEQENGQRRGERRCNESKSKSTA